MKHHRSLLKGCQEGEVFFLCVEEAPASACLMPLTVGDCFFAVVLADGLPGIQEVVPTMATETLRRRKGACGADGPPAAPLQTTCSPPDPTDLPPGPAGRRTRRTSGDADAPPADPFVAKVTIGGSTRKIPFPGPCSYAQFVERVAREFRCAAGAGPRGWVCRYCDADGDWIVFDSTEGLRAAVAECRPCLRVTADAPAPAAQATGTEPTRGQQIDAWLAAQPMRFQVAFQCGRLVLVLALFTVLHHLCQQHVLQPLFHSGTAAPTVEEIAQQLKACPDGSCLRSPGRGPSGRVG